MKIDQTSMDYLAHLARLSLNQDKTLQDDLIHITDMIEQITLVNTEGISPMAHPSQSTQRLRADEVTESDQSAVLCALAPAVEAGLFLVPTVLE